LPIQIPAGFDRWNKASGQVLDVLVERREAEREEFYSSLQVGPPLKG
jgi:GH24 family phage-related lysozyme (muramidase)